MRNFALGAVSPSTPCRPPLGQARRCFLGGVLDEAVLKPCKPRQKCSRNEVTWWCICRLVGQAYERRSRVPRGCPVEDLIIKSLTHSAALLLGGMSWRNSSRISMKGPDPKRTPSAKACARDLQTRRDEWQEYRQSSGAVVIAACSDR